MLLSNRLDATSHAIYEFKELRAKPLGCRWRPQANVVKEFEGSSKRFKPFIMKYNVFHNNYLKLSLM